MKVNKKVRHEDGKKQRCHSLGCLPRSWVVFYPTLGYGFFSRRPWLFSGVFKSPWVFSFFYISPENTRFLDKSKELVVVFCSFGQKGENCKIRGDD